MTEARRKQPKKSKRKSGARPEEAPAEVRREPARAQEPRDPADDERQSAEAELALGRNLALWVPALTVAVAGVVGGLFSAGPAILVLGVGALVGGIAFFWGSVRSLSGEAPISPRLLAAAPRSLGASDGAAEQKRLVLRSLKDLESERNFGKISEEDYQELAATYRARAKQILREMDESVAPLRGEAERMASRHLARRGLAPDAAEPGAGEPAAEAESPSPQDTLAKVACPKCTTANDSDAAFCKKCGTKLAKPTEAVDDDAGDDAGDEEGNDVEPSEPASDAAGDERDSEEKPRSGSRDEGDDDA